MLGLVPARGGSKGVPGKNLRLLGGKPLFVHSVDAAFDAALDGVFVSTDDERTAEVARAAGAEVPFLRPPELARDDTGMLEVVMHFARWCSDGGVDYDALCLLQPTAPFRGSGAIRSCIERLEASGADAVVSVRRVPDEYHPSWAYFADERGELRLALGGGSPTPRRQELPAAYHRDGSIYLTRRAVVEAGSLYGRRCVMWENAEPCWVNIDTEEDWQRAQALLGTRFVGGR